MTNKSMVYVSGALSDVPDAIRAQYLEFYEAIADAISSLNLIPYVPHLNTDPVRHKDVTPSQVDFIDRTAVMSSSLMVAVADNPSLGVGIEVEMAYHSNKPVILLCHSEKIATRRISRLVRGNPAVIGEIVYDDFGDALIQLKASIEAYLTEQKQSVLPDILRMSA